MKIAALAIVVVLAASEPALAQEPGKGTFQSQSISFDLGGAIAISLDVAVMGDDHGAALPLDGGAPGKAYLAHHVALLKRDSAALRPTLTSGGVEIWDRSKKNGELDEYVAYLANKHLLTSVRITKGWARADVASLLVEGDGPAGTLSGEVLLLREKDA